jgi:diacylglycerol kinase (ATP)
MVGSVLLVMTVELLNSAIEAAVDRVSLENHRLAEGAPRTSAGAAVLTALANVFCVWACIL